MLIIEPTVVKPSSRCGFTASMAAFSMSATICGVANTSRLPLPKAMAVCCFSTVSSDVCVSPVSIVVCREIVGHSFKVGRCGWYLVVPCRWPLCCERLFVVAKLIFSFYKRSIFVYKFLVIRHFWTIFAN